MSKALFEMVENKPKNKSKLFELINPVKLDPDKPTMAILTMANFKPEYNHKYGFMHEVIDAIKDRYNIIYIGKEIKKNVQKIENFYILSSSGYGTMNSKELKRKKEDENNVEHNLACFEKEYEDAFGNLEIDYIMYMNPTYAQMPLTSYKSGEFSELLNEFHDFVDDNDQETLAKTKDLIGNVCENFNNKVSLLAFTMWYKNVFMNLPVWFNNRKKLKHLYIFNIDPMYFNDWFDHNGIKNTRYYFADDTRGTRRMSEFPISHLQHIIHENKFFYTDHNNLPEKTKDFFYMGAILTEKGSRRDMWYKFLHDLRIDDAKFYIPLKLNGIFENKKDITSKISKDNEKKAQDKFPELMEQIAEHPNYEGFCLPQEVKDIIQHYKYTLVMRCVSFKDSLNFRPVQYAYMKILPLLDPMYDPNYLQYPKEIQDKLVVNNHEEILERIAYFNENDQERRELLDKIYDHFQVEKYLSDEWKDDIQNYFDTSEYNNK